MRASMKLFVIWIHVEVLGTTLEDKQGNPDIYYKQGRS